MLELLGFLLATFFGGLWWVTDRQWKKTLDLCERAVAGWERAEKELGRRSQPGEEWKD